MKQPVSLSALFTCRQSMRSLLCLTRISFMATVLAVATVSCSSKTTLGTRSLNETLPESTLPGTLSLLGVAVQIPLSGSLPIPLSAEAQSLADETEFVTFARLRSLTLRILDTSESEGAEDGAMDNFDFLSGMEVFVSAIIGGEASEVLVASLPEGDPQIGTGVRALTMTVEDVDVLDYIEAPGGYALRVQGSGFVPPDDVVFDGEIRYRVGIGRRTDR